jgi:hypothetical protein
VGELGEPVPVLDGLAVRRRSRRLASGTPRLQRARARATSFASLRGRSLAEQNAEIEREAVRNIANHPDAYIGNVLANVSRMLVNAPYSRVDWQWNDLFYAVPNLLLLAVAVVTAVVLVPLRRALPPETAPFAVLGAVAFGLHALVASYPRMLAPIVPLVVWLATLAFVERGALTRVRRRRPLPSESA